MNQKDSKNQQDKLQVKLNQIQNKSIQQDKLNNYFVHHCFGKFLDYKVHNLHFQLDMMILQDTINCNHYFQQDNNMLQDIDLLLTLMQYYYNMILLYKLNNY